jgi:Excinuclease ATPase subunit
LCVKINKLNISEVTRNSIEEAQKWFSNLENILTLRDKKIAKHILKERNERINGLGKVGLNYITLCRESGTLSGGESKRIRMASQIGTGITGVLYV